MISAKWSAVSLLLCALCVAAPASAQPPGRGARPPSPELDDAVANVRGRVKGRVISAETQEQDGEPRHVIRVLTPDGRVRRMQVEGGSGRMVAPPDR